MLAPPWGVGTPSSGKSWIYHWYRLLQWPFLRGGGICLGGLCLGVVCLGGLPGGLPDTPLWTEWQTRVYKYKNEVWGKVICLQVCGCPQGGCLVRGSGAWSGGCLVWRGVPGPGGKGRGWWVPERGAWWRHPPGRLLLWAVRILVECILVFLSFSGKRSFCSEH